MTNKPESPNAFPHGDPEHGFECGMTLRDYFAGQVILAYIEDFGKERDFLVDEDRAQDAATNAYIIADAMLKARQS